jgi:hypothetical protein
MTTLGRTGKCLRDRSEKGHLWELRAHQMRNRPSRRRWKHRGPKPAKTLQREVVQPIRELESESQNGNPGLGMIVAID